MFPIAKDCGFLAAEKPFDLLYPVGCIPAGIVGGKRAVFFNDGLYLLAVTKSGWFALFPASAHQETVAAAVTVRLEFQIELNHTAVLVRQFIENLTERRCVVFVQDDRRHFRWQQIQIEIVGPAVNPGGAIFIL